MELLWVLSWRGERGTLASFYLRHAIADGKFMRSRRNDIFSCRSPSPMSGGGLFACLGIVSLLFGEGFASVFEKFCSCYGKGFASVLKLLLVCL